MWPSGDDKRLPCAAHCPAGPVLGRIRTPLANTRQELIRRTGDLSSRQPVEQTGCRKQQHDDPDRKSGAVECRGGRLLRDDDSRHRLEGLDRHRHPVNDARDYLHNAEHHENTGSIESGGERHPDEERHVRPQVAERSRELVAVEPYPGRRDWEGGLRQGGRIR